MQKSKVLHRSRTKETLSRSRAASATNQPQNKELDLKLYEKFLKFMTKTRLQNLKEKMAGFYGRNFPINYHPKYNFLEEWQGLERKEERSLYELIHSESALVQLTCLFVMLTNTYIVWSLSVERVFRSAHEPSPLYALTLALGLANRVASAGLRLYLERVRREHGMRSERAAAILGREAVGAVYLGLGAWGAYGSPVVVVLEVVVSAQLFAEARKYYKFVRIIELSLLYEYQFKIMDLMINLFIIAHFLSLFLYLGALYDPDCNWVSAIHAQHDSYLAKYLYSLYFCCTTILTIGYGDISPKNKLEILIVIVVELFGVIVFGYLINEIGHTLSIMRKNEENLQKDLTVLTKIEKFYNLEGRLVNQAKGYLITNRNALVELTPDEEKNLLAKLNEELRTVIINEKSLAIVKTSIFFLCRWSKEMQTSVAARLQKALYLPNERLLQPPGSERIYIIKRGRIDIYCDRLGHARREDRRLMKSIRIRDGHGINQNIYGYTAVISLRPTSLDALSAEFTSCYFIDREGFLKCVRNTQADFEYYHEIKSKIDQSEFCEAFEAPSILNIREHYNPSRTILIRKTNAQLARLRNTREVFVRCQRRNVRKHCFKNILRIIEEINDKLISNSNDFIELSILNRGDEDIGKCSDHSIEEAMRETRTKKSQTVIPRAEESHSHQMSSLVIEPRGDLMPSLAKKAFHHHFERAQEYKNFFHSNNLSEVIKSLENENYNFQNSAQPLHTIKLSTQKLFDFGFHHERPK